ncbi:PREDICTED: uncharacterized protein LOC109581309 isoform X1 [Amphimedon queenslandica]|uniref:G-protein coupled receptors family 1 profile domain-containing protein n=1 Tax=Amphimedon queenslandica TaxID=400682 RepID=A0A1X7VUA8_AMPQE|nr:PREDICTED: uncharacterized protein LOC109581309 isoform X1 [Amphimedon queenslandica]|eukprot:XP_019850890.1 PREDICTED: uncharacterized protein LOC109581309 isoform X1 [Amphimedon queenslandica]
MGLALLTTVFFFVLYSSVQADNVTCISNYADLKDALRDKETDNVRRLLDTFYPPDGSPVHFLYVTYCLSDSKTECNPTFGTYNYHWADTRLLLVIEPNLLVSLTLDFIKLGVKEITLTISPPFCSNESESNVILLDTLTTWLKHYATSDEDESDRGYVAYVSGSEFPITTENLIFQLLVPYGLLTVVINILIILSFRVCSRTMAERIDKAVERAISTVQSSVSDEQEEKERPPFLKTISSPGHNTFYVLAVVFLTVYDMRLFTTIETKYNYLSWFVFFPVPFIAPLCLTVGVITPICIKGIGYLRGATEYETKKDTINHIMTIALLITLSSFALFHGFWMAMLFAVYPSIALSRALILIPMYLPILIIYRKIPYFVRKFRELYKKRGRKDGNQDGKVTIAALCYVVFVIVVMWPAVLLLINYISNYFIIVNELAGDILQLIVIVAIVTLITYRLAKVFVEVDQEDEDTGYGEADDEVNLPYGEVNNSYEPPSEEVRGLNYEGIKETTIQMEETTLHAGRENEVDADDETMPIPYNDGENRAMPVPYVLVK